MAAQNFTVNGTSHATAEAITGLTADTEYSVQNQTGATLYAYSKATQPVDEVPASFGPGAWFTIIARSGEQYWVWLGNDREAGKGLYIEEVGDA